MSEAAIQREIVKFLRMIGGAVWVTSQGYRKDPGGTRMTPGLPDLVVMFPMDLGLKGGVTRTLGTLDFARWAKSRWTFAEVKTAKGKLSPAQVEFRDESIKAGVPWHLWRSVEDAKSWAVSVGLVVTLETVE